MSDFDIARKIYDKRKHYASTRMQQGRVLTENDWNEAADIEERMEQRTYVDIIGGYGTPNQGFRIMPKDIITTDGFIDFKIHSGTMYLGGLRLEMDEDEFFRVQQDWLQKNDSDFMVPTVAELNAMPDHERYDLVYLEGWQQGVSAVEDNTLLEVALGGPDTVFNLRNFRRVGIYKNCESPECPIAWKKLRTDWDDNLHLGSIKKYELVPDSTLTVSFTNAGLSDDLCAPSVIGGYLGAENQAIRVQRTRQNMFTWGFDNASPLYRVKVSIDGLTVTMDTLPKDQYHWPRSGQTVELLPWSAALPNNQFVSEHVGQFSTVELSYDPDKNFFTLPVANPLQPADLSVTPQEYYYMRLWNRGDDVNSDPEILIGAVPIVLGNTGLQIQFTGVDSIPGDYWVIAARPDTPQAIVPADFLNPGRKPHGLRRFYAPLAIIRWTIDGSDVKGKVIRDCRKHFNPLTQQECCCTYTVGDGITSKGDFRKIQDAIDALPGDGGKICILPGIHDANVIIGQLKKVHIEGCGEQAIVRTELNSSEPIFLIKKSQNIRIDNLTMFTLNGIAVEVRDEGEGSPSEAITIRENRILAFKHAIRVVVSEIEAGDNCINILYNLVGMFNLDGGDVAIFSQADDVLIEQNRIVMVSPPPPDEDEDPNPDPDGIFDPCLNLKSLYLLHHKFKKSIDDLVHFVTVFVSTGTVKNYLAKGGIKIAGSSEKVYILRNEIMGGNGNGITLGHEIIVVIEGDGPLTGNSTSLYDISIEKNLIREMGLSGIGALSHPNDNNKEIPIHIENIQVLENNIMYCVQTKINEDEGNILRTGNIPASGIALAYCEDCIIRDNWIDLNGKDQELPVSGIFVFYTENIDVSSNRIFKNGAELAKERTINFNVKGGIVIWAAYKLPELASNQNISNNIAANNIASNIKIPVFDAVPAARIHNNIVSQPLGHALFLTAIGPVSVVGNQFNSQGVNRGELFSLIAATVLIFDLGITKDLFNIIYLPMKYWRNVNASKNTISVSNKPKNPGQYELLQLIPSGRIMYTANQVMLDLRSLEGDKCFCSELLFTLDDLAFVNNQSECSGFGAFRTDTIAPVAAESDMMRYNTVLFAISTRCNDNRFTDGFVRFVAPKGNGVTASLLSLSLLNTVMNNQSTHCLIAPFWLFRRKGMNTQLTATLCSDPKIDSEWSNTTSPNFNDPRFNYVMPTG